MDRNRTVPSTTMVNESVCEEEAKMESRSTSTRKQISQMGRFTVWVGCFSLWMVLNFVDLSSSSSSSSSGRRYLASPFSKNAAKNLEAAADKVGAAAGAATGAAAGAAAGGKKPAVAAAAAVAHLQSTVNFENDGTTVIDLPPNNRTNATPNANCHTRPIKNQTYCLPKFIIGGAMKCGTNEAGRLISRHPRAKYNLCPNTNKEERIACRSMTDVHQGIFLSNEKKLNLWESAPEWLFEGVEQAEKFMFRYPPTDGVNTMNFDKSPAFLDTHIQPDYPRAVQLLMPGVKMVFTLCDPSERMVSEYYHYQRDPELLEIFKAYFTDQELKVPADLPDFIDILVDENSEQCVENPEGCRYVSKLFLPKGTYVNGINDWFKLFSPDEILILDMEADESTNAKKMVDFAELPLEEYPFVEKKKDDADETRAFHNEEVEEYKGRSAVWKQHPKAMEKLAAFYADYNKGLAQVIHQEFPLKWNKKLQDLVRRF